MKIFKYSTPLKDLKDIIYHRMPKGAIVISAINQREYLCIYAQISQEEEYEKKSFKIIPTGGDDINIDYRYWRFINTVSFQNGDLVFHIYA